MRLKEALSILSKSSAYAVSTERSNQELSLLDEIKAHLYIKMPIEDKVKKIISSFGANDKKLLFLCGSSGDGKSELLTKVKRKKKYSKGVRFHLDATHSFDPQGSAIDTLNRVFDDYQAGSYPLVVGINTGMIGNYAEEGRNAYVREALKAYLTDKRAELDDIYFVSFEDYPKFEINENEFTSEFANSLLARITEAGGVIWNLVEKERQLNDPDSAIVLANYTLLCQPSVQQVIIDLLFKARLMRDQFLTARALLDFIHELLLGGDYLFDNLFAGGTNELANKIEHFDPAHLRTKQIDRFILSFNLNLPNPDFEQFKQALKSLGVSELQSGTQYLRLFYVFKYDALSNNFHQQFESDFNESLIDKYIAIFQLHKEYTGSTEQKSKLKTFYRDVLISAVRNYINRNAPKLGKKYFLLSDFGDYQIAAPAELSMDVAMIQNSTTTSSAFFNARLKLRDKQFCLPININLLELLININSGYRPNKHDKNSVILLDELANEVIQAAKASEELVITGEGNKYLLELEDDEIMVSEG
ncbi:DNA phosphorothioation-dependent restriction protein DptF [Pseudoalteromonas sp. OOF1S-7]|uniref:DNA phosphorothioation-dependent restriction protein DptF n=1 Tax=Pseudoalteromonas sp. OOF1S-7 TaxID=2917757 RepID=UPI001EF70F69|nr:DNA phosphorothioation-dependent restriction protein DptF [Pseudoalteromonas sp. OOF1S-7]MCG7534119.1 DNA phosphorothioation-dependent restriction protein DptF [Pseudoalteromonas sp. OOF1S-7]